VRWLRDELGGWWSASAAGEREALRRAAQGKLNRYKNSALDEQRGEARAGAYVLGEQQFMADEARAGAVMVRMVNGACVRSVGEVGRREEDTCREEHGEEQRDASEGACAGPKGPGAG
jgi:hypothetical protein